MSKKNQKGKKQTPVIGAKTPDVKDLPPVVTPPKTEDKKDGKVLEASSEVHKEELETNIGGDVKDVQGTDKTTPPEVKDDEPQTAASIYVESILGQMKQYEEDAHMTGGITQSKLVIAQNNLWSIVETALNQQSLQMARVGITTILNRMEEKENYKIKFLFRCIANPVDVNPVIKRHTVKTYNMLIEYIEGGRKNLSGRVDLDGVTEHMNDVETNNVMSIFATS